MLDEFQLCLKDVSKLAKDGEQVVQDLLHFKFSASLLPTFVVLILLVFWAFLALLLNSYASLLFIFS